MDKIECPTKIVVSAQFDITPERVLTLERYLNDAIANAVWLKLDLGVRFHVSMPVQFVEKTKED